MVSRVKSTPHKADAKPGRVLRALRTQHDWTLAEVSERTGLPVSTLSKIENDKMSLSYDKLTRLCAGLDIDIAELFASEAGGEAPSRVTGRRSITRAGEGRAIDTADYLHLYPAADLLNKRFVPIIAEIHARSLDSFGELIRHPGEEYAYVLEGTVDLHTDLYAPTRLEAGDSIYFDSGMGHAYIAASPGRCRVLSICSASESQLLEATAELRPPEPPKPVAKSARSSSKAKPPAKAASKKVSKPTGRARGGKS
jgi:transcriptional regulator with XRE-family HTH domain